MRKAINILICALLIQSNDLTAQTGYYDAPYVRYEADLGTLNDASSTTRSYAQSDLQSEASGQVCVNLPNAGSSVEWTVTSDGDGLVVRYSIPDGESAVLDVYVNNVDVGDLNLTTYYSWENLGFTNPNPKMRFDEVRFQLPSPVLSGGSLKLVNQSGNIHVDFAELESVPAAIASSAGDVIYSGDGSDLQTFIDANGGNTIYLPAGVYNVDRELYFGVDNTTLKGAGIWYTEIHFTHTTWNGGLRANANGISYSDLYLTTVRNSRSDSYKAINGVYTSTSTITNVWAEHFECGAWIAQYNTGGPSYADGFIMSNCRFRNNYADGINLCKGTRNAIVEHCNFRNNGDDDMAIWSANGLECQNNTFSYNTSENCWRASGCAIYGGYNNKADHLLIKDNLEVGLRVNNSYSGVGFNNNGMHEFSDITIIGCGTFNDLWNGNVGAIDIVCDNIAGTRVQNVKFSNIDIINSKNDAIYIWKKNGEGFYNLIFENITIDGTGKEYPYNNANNLNWGRGYGILFVGNPSGYGIYCNLTYSNRGGNALSDINNAQQGSFTFTETCIDANTPELISATTFGMCDDPITLEATATPPASNTVDYIEFFVDDVSVGQDNSSAYSIDWNDQTVGDHQIKAIAHYTPSGTVSSSLIQTVTIVDGIYATTTVPVIDGVIDAVWGSYSSFSLDKVPSGSSFSGPSDLSASFKLCRDASNLYILLDVTDDILRTDGAEDWQKDGLELYIDMGNDKAGSYGSDDRQYRFIYGITTPQPGLTFTQTTKAGNLGYIIEIKIPWSTLGLTPSEGDFIGIDLHVEDNDTGVRNGKKVWADATDNAWQSTSVLGTLQIAGCVNPLLGLIPGSSTEETIGISFYPNPFQESGNLKINSINSGSYTISIRDMSGKLIHESFFTGNGPHSIGETLLPGIYIAEVSDGSNKETIKLTKF